MTRLIAALDRLTHAVLLVAEAVNMTHYRHDEHLDRAFEELDR